MVFQNVLSINFFLAAYAIFFLSYPASGSVGDSLTFSGSLSVNGSHTYKYKMVLAPVEGRWRGYSVLDEGGADETKSSVGAQFSKERKGMVFAENTVIASKSKEQTFCFVNGVLKLSGKQTLKGFFVGRDKQKNICGDGSIKLTVPASSVALMTPDGSRDTLPKIVTESISQSFRTSSREIFLELWDGGNVDQDSLSVSLNGVLVANPFAISAERKRVAIRLKPGTNKISIKAHNEGAQPPNSARIYFDDGTEHYTLVSYLKSGQEATISVHCQ